MIKVLAECSARLDTLLQVLRIELEADSCRVEGSTHLEIAKSLLSGTISLSKNFTTSLEARRSRIERLIR